VSHQADRNSDLVEVIKRNGDCGTVCRCYHLRAHCCTLSNEKLSQDGSGTLIGRVGTLRVPSFRTRNFTNAGSRNTCKSRTLATKSVADIGSPPLYHLVESRVVRNRAWCRHSVRRCCRYQLLKIRNWSRLIGLISDLLPCQERSGNKSRWGAICG